MVLNNVDVIEGKKCPAERIDQKLLAAFEKLLANSGAIHVLAIHDTDCPAFSVTHFPGGETAETDTIEVASLPPAKPITFQRPTFAMAILAAAGMEPVKKCSGKCKRMLPVSSFSEHAGRRDGYSSICFACSRVRKPRSSDSPAVQATTTRDRIEILRHRAQRKLPLSG